jgi:hypothetical protein
MKPSHNRTENIGTTHLESAISQKYKKQPCRLSAHVRRTVVMRKYKILNMGNNITCITYCNNRITGTLYTVETWLVSGI